MGWGVSISSNATTYHKSCCGLLSNSDNTQFFSTAWQLANLKVLKSFRIHFVPKSYGILTLALGKSKTFAFLERITEITIQTISLH